MPAKLAVVDQLALNLAASPGEYVLLLGSGVSRTSGIPTGWEICLDLVRRIAKVQGEDVGAESAEAWFTSKNGTGPRYSEILEMSGPTRQARQQLIRGYFERRNDEPEDAKRPTKAHRAVAQMVRDGYLKIIVTTNFDRLMESALEEVGIAPVVIATPAQFAGAGPLHRNACTIVKLHGDYLDPEILNIDAELGSYTAEMNQLLDRLLDEHGVIVSGWSADYDIALRTAFQRRRTRRFACYWTYRGQLSATAQALVSGQAFISVPVSDADSFFLELESKTQAAASLAGPHPMSESLVVAEAKRALSLPLHAIPYREVVLRCLGEVEHQLANRQAFTNHGNATPQEVTARLNELISIVRPLRRVVALGVFFRGDDVIEPALTSFRRLLSMSAANRAGSSVFIELKRVVPLSLLASVGIASAASNNFSAFAKYLELDDPFRDGRVVSVGKNQYLGRIVSDKRWLVGYDNRYTPVSEFVSFALREELRELLPDDSQFESAFDRYELMSALAYITPAVLGGPIAQNSPNGSGVWLPPGRFCWNWRYRSGRDAGAPWEEIKHEMMKARELWPPTVAGMFNGSVEDAIRVVDAATPFFESVAQRWH